MNPDGEQKKTFYKPKSFSKKEMEKANVEIIDKKKMLLKCKHCKTTWSPNLLEGGRLPRGYWKCPKGCNSK